MFDTCHVSHVRLMFPVTHWLWSGRVSKGRQFRTDTHIETLFEFVHLAFEKRNNFIVCLLFVRYPDATGCSRGKMHHSLKWWILKSSNWLQRNHEDSTTIKNIKEILGLSRWAIELQLSQRRHPSMALVCLQVSQGGNDCQLAFAPTLSQGLLNVLLLYHPEASIESC